LYVSALYFATGTLALHFLEISSERSLAGRYGAQSRASLIVIGAPAVYVRVQNESVDVAEATKGQ